MLVRKGNEGIYQGHPFLKETLVWTKNQNKWLNLLRLIKQVRKNKYDCVINCHRYASSGMIAGYSGAAHIAGYKENPFSFLFNYCARHKIGDGRHETERYNELIEDFAGKTVFKPRLYPSPAETEKIKPYLNEIYVCMAPASVWFTKQLPASKWTELCQNIPPHYTIYLLGSGGDKDLCESIKNTALRQNVLNLAGQLSLLESCALMQQAKMNYVNDSAPLHLASSVNAPVTAFFLSTVPAFGFGPLSSSSQIVEVEGLNCRPCGLHGHRQCPKGHFKCANPVLPVLKNE